MMTVRVALSPKLLVPPASRCMGYRRHRHAPPMTYAVDGKQYIAIASGLTRNQMNRLVNTPELKNFATNATIVFVFAL